MSRLNKTQKQGIISAIVCTGLIAIAWGLAAPLIAQNLERMTGSGQLLGILIALAAVATILFPPTVPKLLQFYSPKTVMVTAISISALTLPLLKIFMFPNAWLLIKFISSAAFTIVFVLAETWINQLAPERLRGRIMGVYGAALAGGMGLGSGLAVITGIDGWSPFLVCGAINLAAILPFIIWTKAKQVKPTSKNNAKLALMLKIMKIAPSIMMMAIVFGAIEQIMIYFLPVYETRLGGTESMGRQLLLIAALGNFLLQIPMGFLADKMNRRILAIILMAIAATGPVFMIIFSAHFYILSGLAFVYIGLTTALYTVGLVRLGERFKGEKLAAANAAFITAYGIGSLITPPLAGKMMDIYDPHGFLWTMAVLGALGLVVLLIAEMRTRAII